MLDTQDPSVVGNGERSPVNRNNVGKPPSLPVCLLQRTMDIHPTVPNPYNLLSTLKPGYNWYTVLDLKDAFFCLPLAPQSQELSTFEWKDPEKGISGQLTWTRLPQGFKNSPTLFDETLHRDLTDFRTQKSRSDSTPVCR